MGNISLSHLMDHQLFPFTTLKPTGQADAAGDKAFDDDEEPCATPTPAAGPQVVMWAPREAD